MKTYKGNAKAEMGWSFMGLVAHEDGATWILFGRQKSTGWTSLKLIAEERAPFKANYWLGWNGSRLSKTRDEGLLLEGRPALHRALINKLREEL